MNERQLLEVLHFKTLTIDGNTNVQAVPITLPVTQEEHDACKDAAAVALRNGANGKLMAVIKKPEFFTNRKEEVSTRLFGTFSAKHPKIERIMEQGPFCVSGERLVVLEKRIVFNDGLDQFRLTPQEIRDQARKKNADVLYAFQVRNPLHNGHVLLLQDTRRRLLDQGYKNPVLLLHPLGGWVKDDDVPLDTRMKQHFTLVEDGILDESHTILAIWPSPMYYGGPAEVMWHVSSRLNAGVQYFIVGRDPAGVKHPEDASLDLYDPFHGQKVLDIAKPLFKGRVKILPFKVAAYNKKSEAMEFFDPAKKDDFDFISGSRMRKVAREGGQLPKGFMNERGWEVLANYYKGEQ